jgi:hypothetical protein
MFDNLGGPVKIKGIIELIKLMLAGFKLREPKLMFMRLIYIFNILKFVAYLYLKGENCKLETERFIVENS